MPEITTGANGRTDVTSRNKVASSLPQDNFNEFLEISASAHGVTNITTFTSSLGPGNIQSGSIDKPNGFIIQNAGNSVLTGAEGGSIAASVLNTKELYEISVSKVSGSGHIHFVF